MVGANTFFAKLCHKIKVRSDITGTVELLRKLETDDEHLTLMVDYADLVHTEKFFSLSDGFTDKQYLQKYAAIVECINFSRLIGELLTALGVVPFGEGATDSEKPEVLITLATLYPSERKRCLDTLLKASYQPGTDEFQMRASFLKDESLPFEDETTKKYYDEIIENLNRVHPQALSDTRAIATAPTQPTLFARFKQAITGERDKNTSNPDNSDHRNGIN